MRKRLRSFSPMPAARPVFARLMWQTACHRSTSSSRGQPGILCTQTKDYTALLGSDPIAEAFQRADDEAWLFYTSGTTGRPKGAVLSFRNLQFMSHCYYADIDHLDDRDVKLHAAPLSHGSGLYALPHIAKGRITLSCPAHSSRIGSSMCLEKQQNVTMFGAPYHGVAADQPSTGRVLRYERAQDALLSAARRCT